MSKGLEALEWLYLHGEWDFSMEKNIDEQLEENREAIEKELKDYEYLNSFFQKLKDKYEIDDLDYLEHICRNYERLVKKERALEIIKGLPDKYKEGLIYILLNALNERKLIQEEYDLLKEVLL